MNQKEELVDLLRKYDTRFSYTDNGMVFAGVELKFYANNKIDECMGRDVKADYESLLSDYREVEEDLNYNQSKVDDLNNRIDDIEYIVDKMENEDLGTREGLFKIKEICKIIT